MVVSILITVLVVAVIGVWRHFRLKERRIARAYTFLTILKRDGSTVDSSNRMALTIDMFAANQLKARTALHIDKVFNGKHLALISEARAQGFRG